MHGFPQEVSSGRSAHLGSAKNAVNDGCHPFPCPEIVCPSKHGDWPEVQALKVQRTGFHQFIKLSDRHLVQTSVDVSKSLGTVGAEIASPPAQYLLREYEMRPEKDRKQVPAFWVIPGGTKGSNYPPAGKQYLGHRLKYPCRIGEMPVGIDRNNGIRRLVGIIAVELATTQHACLGGFAASNFNHLRPDIDADHTLLAMSGQLNRTLAVPATKVDDDAVPHSITCSIYFDLGKSRKVCLQVLAPPTRVRPVAWKAAPQQPVGRWAAQAHQVTQSQARGVAGTNAMTRYFGYKSVNGGSGAVGICQRLG